MLFFLSANLQVQLASIEIALSFLCELNSLGCINLKHFCGNIQEEVLSDFGYDLCYDMAQQYGHAQLVWYALNGTRVVEGEYTDRD